MTAPGDETTAADEGQQDPTAEPDGGEAYWTDPQ